MKGQKVDTLMPFDFRLFVFVSTLRLFVFSCHVFKFFLVFFGAQSGCQLFVFQVLGEKQHFRTEIMQCNASRFSIPGPPLHRPDLNIFSTNQVA